MIEGVLEIVPSGRFRITLSEEESGDSLTSGWYHEQEVGVLAWKGDVYLAVSPMGDVFLGRPSVYRLVEVPTEVERVGE